MTIFAFLLGLSLTLGWHYWQQSLTKKEIKQMLKFLPPDVDEESALSLMYRLRRGINLMMQQYRQLEMLLGIQKDAFEQAPVGYLQVDREGQLLWCNQKARQFLKLERWQPGQVRLLLELVRSVELDHLIQETIKKQKFLELEWVFQTATFPLNQKEKSTYSLALKASSFPLLQGDVAIFLENQQPWLELKQSRDRTFSDLTHELRTPLTSIRLVAEALEPRVSPTEKRWIEQMLQEINRLINLIQDCLDLSQLENDPNASLELQVVSLKELLFGIWQTLEPMAQTKNLTLAYHGPDSLTLQADPARLTQVFLNLFDNSIKHSPPQGVIQVKAIGEGSDHWVTIDVVDSGEGFRSEDLVLVFERLYRSDASRQRSSFPHGELSPRRGTGLGLAIVQQIIQAHQGTITAHNHPQTGGAWLQIRLPKIH